MHSCDESLFLALNFDGGPCLDRIMTLISGMAIWIPFYLLILWLVCRRYGWRNTLLFLAALALALVLSDMLCGIFKHSGPLKHLWADFPPRWRPMFSPALEGLDIPADSLFAWRHAGLPTPNSLVHVPAGAVAGKYGTVSSHAATIAAVVVMSAAVTRPPRGTTGRRHPPPLVHMARDRRSAADLLLAHLPGQTLPRRSVARHRRRHPDGSFHALAL